MQAKAFIWLNRFPSQKYSFIKCEATNRYSAWIIHGNENTSTSCSVVTKHARDSQQVVDDVTMLTEFPKPNFYTV